MKAFSMLCLGVVLSGVLAVAGCGSSSGGTEPAGVTLLNVSYDPTRELWKELNEKFIADYKRRAGVDLTITQSHGGSGSQARSVIDGLDADVVTLAMWSDIDAIRKAGLLAEGWEDRLPENSLPYISTIVFVVRKGNPKGIKDWPDLVKDGVEIVTPNPKTSGNGKLSFLAAWGSVVLAGGTESEARDYVTQLYRQTPVLDTAARAATTTFAQKEIGDVHLTWENEAHLEVQESEGKLEIVYPSQSIRAEPHVAVVDSNVDRRGTRAAVDAYLKYLYTAEGQEIIGRHFYRPIDEEVRKKYADTLPTIKLFSITDIAAGWNEANERFFAEGALFDSIYGQGQ
jgi:sulfate/thiosulfate-binding protein